MKGFSAAPKEPLVFQRC